MLIKFAPTEAEYVAAVQYASRPKVGDAIGWIVLFGFAEFALVFLFRNKAHPTPYSLLWAGFAAIIFLVLSLYASAYFRSAKIARRDFRDTPAVRTESSFDFDQDDYWASSGCRGIKLEDHVMWLKSQEGILLFSQRRLFHFIPFRLKSEGVDFDLFLKRLEQCLGPEMRIKSNHIEGRSRTSQIRSFFGLLFIWVFTAVMIVIIYNLLGPKR